MQTFAESGENKLWEILAQNKTIWNFERDSKVA